MGIHGLFSQLNPSSSRHSLAALSSAHLAAHNRPLVLAIDISIWLFQIQCGKGGSNPALRTFYYRLLRLVGLNIHPLFVFDGPNKPTWKRNKRVGGGGPDGKGGFVKVASVPEFLAKQLLKQFGFTIHVAPGEAEAECALLQREGIVDAVLSEDVDTLCFGAGVLFRNWSAEGVAGQKSPTHVTVYRKEEMLAKTQVDSAGMVLVALMSGGDYIVEGIPGCGIKVACDAARAGFGKELCELAAAKDNAGMRAWRERLQHEIRTNESKFFSRRNTTLTIPEDFPNMEVLGYYTHPCVSSTVKVTQIKASLKWDQDLDFSALREFAKDAFDWNFLGGAKKFIRNLAPAMLVRELRLRGLSQLDEHASAMSLDAQEAREGEMVAGIHGQRTHASVDGQLELRVSYIPAKLVPIDLSIEEVEECEGSIAPSDSDTEGGDLTAPTGTPLEPTSPSKKRVAKPYEPEQLEKIWILRDFLHIGAPLLVEDFEAGLRDPKLKIKAKRKAKGSDTGKDAIVSKKAAGRKKQTTGSDMPDNAMLAYTRVSKGIGSRQGSEKGKDKENIEELSDLLEVERERARVKALKRTERWNLSTLPTDSSGPVPSFAAGVLTDSTVGISAFVDAGKAGTQFKFPAFQLPPPSPPSLLRLRPDTLPVYSTADRISHECLVISDDEETTPRPTRSRPYDVEAIGARTPPRRKRLLVPSPSPAKSCTSNSSQRTLEAYFSPRSKKLNKKEVIDLLSSSPGLRTPTPRRSRSAIDLNVVAGDSSKDLLGPDHVPREDEMDQELRLPDSVTKRRKKRRKGEIERSWTTPIVGHDGDDLLEESHVVNDTEIDLRKNTSDPSVLEFHYHRCQPNAPSSPVSNHDKMPSPSSFFRKTHDTRNRSITVEVQATKKQIHVGVTAQTIDLCASSSSKLAPQPPLPDCRDIFDPYRSAITPLDAYINRISKPRTTTTKINAKTSSTIATTAPPPPAQQLESPDTDRRLTCKEPTRDGHPSLPAPVEKKATKKRIVLRESLPGAFKEVDAVDLSGDGSGWKMCAGSKVDIIGNTVAPTSGHEIKKLDKRYGGWRKSGIEVLDLTGA